MGASLAVQQAMYTALRNGAALAALLADDARGGSPSEPAVYDEVPQTIKPENPLFFPYVVVGDDTAIQFDTDDVRGEEATVTLHIWDRRRGRKRCKQIVDAIYDLLHDTDLDVHGQHTVLCFWEFSASVPDPEPLIQHYVTRFRVITQQV